MTGYVDRLFSSVSPSTGWQNAPRRPWSPRSSRGASLDPTNRLRIFVFYGSAVALGLLVQAFLSTAFLSPSSSLSPQREAIWGHHGLNSPLPPSGPPPDTDLSWGDKANTNCTEEHGAATPLSHGYITPFVRPGLGQYVTLQENTYGESQLREMIATTKGFYARDYSLWLGWNNVSEYVYWLVIFPPSDWFVTYNSDALYPRGGCPPRSAP